MPRSRDYYETLGVARGASKDEVRAAHRRLARELHPDVNKAPNAAERFKEVQEAYDVLSDDEKREIYDRVGHQVFVSGGGASATGYAGQGGHGPAPRSGTYTWSNVGAPGGQGPFSAEDIGSIFEEFFGRPSGVEWEERPGRSPPRARARPKKQPDVEQEITIPFDLALSGGQQTIGLTRGSESETIEVSIPRGIADGARLRLRGKGRTGREPGDLILTVRIAPHPRYRRDGLDLLADLPVTIVEAALGAKIPVRVPGEAPGTTDTAHVSVPPGAPSGSKLRLKGLGVRTADGAAGDFYAVLKIVPPPRGALSDADQKALRDLGARLPAVRDD